MPHYRPLSKNSVLVTLLYFAGFLAVCPQYALGATQDGGAVTHAQSTPHPACTLFAPRFSKQTLASCERAALIDSEAVSVLKRPIYLQDVAAPSSKTKVLVIGGIHGDEITSVALAFYWMDLAKEIGAQTHWRFIPALNPDGFLIEPPSRTNANKVDLNRNFPTPEWDTLAPVYWEQRTGKDPRRWPGPQPMSEPETQFLLNQIQAFAPDLIVSIHAPYGVLDFDGPTSPPQKLGRLYLDQVGIYPGSLGNYGGVHLGIPVVTIELANANRMPNMGEIRQMWMDLLRWKSERIDPKAKNNATTPPLSQGDSKDDAQTKLPEKAPWWRRLWQTLLHWFSA